VDVAEVGDHALADVRPFDLAELEHQGIAQMPRLCIGVRQEFYDRAKRL
jgi:hypothetical protein